MKDKFIQAIKSKNRIVVTFFSKEDGRNLRRECAPMDYGPSKREKNKSARFHVWDFESDKKQHPLLLKPEQVLSLEVLEKKFDPAEFVTWQPDWSIRRDWGKFS